MTAAMMLPTTLPLLEIFRRMTAARADRRRLLALVIGGYLGVWGGFGLIAHLADQSLHEMALQSAWLTFDGWLIGAAVLALAGLFQFQRAEVPLPGAMPHAARLHRPPLAGRERLP